MKISQDDGESYEVTLFDRLLPEALQELASGISPNSARIKIQLSANEHNALEINYRSECNNVFFAELKIALGERYSSNNHTLDLSSVNVSLS